MNKHLTLALAAAAAIGAPDVAAETRTYTLTDLRQTVSNSDVCAAHFATLKQLAEAPFSMQFTKQSGEGTHTAKQLSGPIADYRHTTLKQTAGGSRIHRIVAGSFRIGDTGYEYVMEVSADLGNKDHHYLYPAIFASNDAGCYFSAVIDPSDETVEAFKRHIESGAAAKGMDLHHQ